MHSPLEPQQTREWKNKRSAFWEKQDIRLGGEERSPGNEHKPNQFAKTQQEYDQRHWTAIRLQQEQIRKWYAIKQRTHFQIRVIKPEEWFNNYFFMII